MKHIAILRGINVGGHRPVRMADLKVLAAGLGFQKVESYIQSGNLVFDAPGSSTAVARQLAAALSDRYDFEVPVIVRSARELARIIDDCPFGPVDPAHEGTTVLVTLLDGVPSPAAAAELNPYVKAPEEIVVLGRQVYLRCPAGYGHTKLTNAILERKLGVRATTRNWRTLCKLRDLAEKKG